MPDTTAAVEVLLEDRHCYLIRNCLSLSEQTSIYQDILCRSKDTDNRSKSCMHPTPKTIIFDGNQSSLKFSGDNTYNTLIVQNANGILRKEAQNKSQNGMLSKIMTTSCGTDTKMSIGVIRYHVPDGKFPEHVDHCNDNSWVYLLSLGCSATFVVKGPHSEKQMFQFNSGDVLVFDPSSDAAIVHGVNSIDGSINGDDLPSDCPEDFLQYRFGVQCRVKMQTQKYF
uniref:Alpha-ketoglutarate-dependent dioxygenase AlkB-like domain-containing protein n=1 Tax=Eutreptiella gymnastica TaxID=73025 RepID=A0A7S1NCH2_9EUGL|mmetsp:Transcript_17117/g.30575  ORF Transcript_17117/g.30575 Transcript_17117/m.30575 type:complete len:226 (+) Transcript_17117:174-851(+)